MKIGLNIVRALCLLQFTQSFISATKQNAEGYTSLDDHPDVIATMLSDSFTYNFKQKDLPADICFMFLDLKVNRTKKELKVCEFGEGRLADSIYSQASINKKNLKLITPYWDVLWEYLARLNKPIWFVGKNPERPISSSLIDIPPLERLGWKKFLSIGGHYAKTLSQLEEDNVFNQLSKQKSHKEFANSISDYQGIIIYRYFNTGIASRYEELRAFKKKYPQFLVLNSACEPYASNKLFSASLFTTTFLKQFKPEWGLFPKAPEEALANTIKKMIPASQYVIKPVNSNRTSGVSITSPKELGPLLKRLFKNNKKNLNFIPTNHPYGPVYKPLHPEGEEYWNNDQNSHFLVEKYYASEFMRLNNKFYDPSLRIFIIMRHEQGNMCLDVLNGYWKFPPHSLEDNVPLTAKYKTDPNFIDSFMGITIDDDDLQFIRSTLRKFMPVLYLKMLTEYKNGFKRIFNYNF